MQDFCAIVKCSPEILSPKMLGTNECGLEELCLHSEDLRYLVELFVAGVEASKISLNGDNSIGSWQ
jgi:hypothetical protein